MQSILEYACRWRVEQGIMVIIQYRGRMGAICHTKQQNIKNYTTKSVDLSSSQRLKVNITTKNINKCNEHCLLIFVDTQCNVRKNEFLAEVKDVVGPKLQDYLDVELKSKCMNPGDCLILDVSIEHLKFGCVAILCVNVWEGSSNNSLQDPLEEDIEHALNSILAKGYRSACITNFNAELGIPQRLGDKVLARAISRKQNQFESISIACTKQQHQKSAIEALQMQRSKDQEKKSSLASSIKSDYY